MVFLSSENKLDFTVQKLCHIHNNIHNVSIVNQIKNVLCICNKTHNRGVTAAKELISLHFTVHEKKKEKPYFGLQGRVYQKKVMGKVAVSHMK